MIFLKCISPIILLSSMLTTGPRFMGPAPSATAPATPASAIVTTPSTKIKWIVQKTSTLSIAGKTNINSFCCEVNGYSGPDTISTLTPSPSDDPDWPGIPLKGVLQINIGDFNCRNNAMTYEFKKTLRYREFPLLQIVFLSLDKMPAFSNNGEIIKGWVNVQLAGITKRFEISYTSSRMAADSLELVGSRVFGFSDFGLRPPRKLGGLIRVNDELNVRFHLCLRPST